jgi:hypothetical protein
MGDEKTVLNKRAMEKSKNPRVNSDLTCRYLLMKRYKRKTNMAILIILKTVLTSKITSTATAIISNIQYIYNRMGYS